MAQSRLVLSPSGSIVEGFVGLDKPAEDRRETVRAGSYQDGAGKPTEP